MIKTKYYILIITCLWLQAGLAATPSAFYSALKKIYPLAADVEWSQQGNYHTADFIQNGFDTKVWMNINAQWVMTNTDLQTADQLPPGAYIQFLFTMDGTKCLFYRVPQTTGCLCRTGKYG